MRLARDMLSVVTGVLTARAFALDRIFYRVAKVLRQLAFPQRHARGVHAQAHTAAPKIVCRSREG